MRILYLIVLSTVLLSLSCQQATNSNPAKISMTAQQAVLDTLGKNMKASITDLSEAKRLPTNNLLLKSYYPLSAQELEGLQIAEQQEGSFASDIADQIRCRLLSADLKNEKNEEVILEDVELNPLYLQRFGLWDYHHMLCQNVGISLATASAFSTLKGAISLELQWGERAKKQIDIPVAISIEDNLMD